MAAVSDFETLRAGWSKLLLDRKDEHAIWRQCADLCREARAFRVLRFAGTRLQHRNVPSVLRNPLFFRLVSHGYYARAVLAVRRLTDEPHGEQKKQVVSLPRLLSEIRANRSILCREAFVTFDGTFYDPTEGEAEWFAHLSSLVEKSGDSAAAIWGGPADHGFPDFETSRRRHEAFDRLANRSAQTRLPTDQIATEVFAALEASLAAEPICDIRILGNKRVAHAADAFSRREHGEDNGNLSLRKLEQAHRHILGTAEFIAREFLQDSMSNPGPFGARDELLYLDHAGLTECEFARLQLLPQAVERRFEALQRAGVEGIWQDVEARRARQRRVALQPGTH